MEGREHLTYDRLLKIIGIKASMNLRLSDTLKKAIPSVIPAVKPLVVNQVVKDPPLLAEFMAGKSCLKIGI